MDGCSKTKTFETGIGTVLRISIPLVAAAVTTTLNGFTDNFFLARFSESALRASIPANAFAGFFTTLITVTLGYCGTMLATAHGGGHRARAIALASNGLYLALLSTPVFLAAMSSSHLVLGLFGHDPKVLGQESTLASIILAAGPLAALSSVSAGFFAGQGLTRIVGVATVLGASAKIVLTPLFVFGIGPLPEMGISGAGCSYVASSLFICVSYALMATRNPLAVAALRHRRLLTFRPKIALGILRLGAPLCGRTIVGQGSFFALVALIGRLDATSVAASSAVCAINCPFYAVVTGVREGVEILTGRLNGQRDREGIRRIIRSASVLSLFLSAVYIATLFCFGRNLLGAFLSSDTPLDRTAFFTVGQSVILMFALRIAFEFLSEIIHFILRGIGRTDLVLLTGVIVAFAIWIPGLSLVTIFHPTAPAYWMLTILTSIAGGTCNLAFLLLQTRHAFGVTTNDTTKKCLDFTRKQQSPVPNP